MKLAFEIVGGILAVGVAVIGLCVLAIGYRFSEDADSGNNPFE